MGVCWQRGPRGRPRRSYAVLDLIPTTFGIPNSGAADPNALNCAGLRNMTEQPEHA